MSSLLIEGSTTLAHDNFNSYFPAFHFFLDNLGIGQLPLWNPYSHGGEPFYPILLQERLLEPLTYLNLALLRPFFSDYILLHNWNRFLETLFTLFGTYLVLRRYTSLLLTRVLLLFGLSLSSMMLGSFQQEGILHQYLWAPYLVLVLQTIIEDQDRRWRGYVLFGILLGVNFQSYLFGGVSLCLLFGLAGTLFYFPKEFKKHLSEVENLKRWAVAFGVTLLMTGPNLAVFWERGDYVFPMRMFSETFAKDQIVTGPMQWEGGPEDIRPAIGMSFDLAWRTGSTSNPWDFVQLVAPGGNPIIHGLKKAWGDPSEAFMYLGVFFWVFSIIGIFTVQDRISKVWRVSFFGWALILLGGPGGLHRLLFPVFPPLWVMRNTHCLVLFFQLTAFYFFVRGWESFLKSEIKTKIAPLALPYILVCGGVLFSLLNWSCTQTLLGSLKMPYAIVAAFFTLVLFRQFLSPFELACSVLLTQIVFAGKNTSHFPMFFCFLLLALATPLIIAVILKKEIWYRNSNLVLSTSIVLLVSGDLFYHFHLSRHLYQLQPHPKLYLESDTKFKLPQIPQTRQVAEYYPNFFLKTDPPIQQIPRYLSLILRKPFALSPIFEWKDKIPKSDFESALLSKRWNSFFLLKNYFYFTHSHWGSQWIQDAFAIQSPLAQFRLRTHSELEGLFLVQDKDSISKVNFRSYAYSSAKMETFNSRLGYLYFSDGYHRHWNAKLDGNSVPLHLANDNFKAIELPPGNHLVEFYYFPQAFLFGVYCFFGTFTIGLAGVSFLYVSDRFHWRPRYQTAAVEY